MKRELVCIVCPVGCNITVDFEGEKIKEISGNNCPRGKAYAETECISPVRTITTTVRCENGEILPVKTDKPIPKEKIFEAMKIINKACPHLPISAGDVIIDDVFGAGVVAVSNMGGCFCENDKSNCCNEK